VKITFREVKYNPYKLVMVFPLVILKYCSPAVQKDLVNMNIQ